MKTSLPLLLAGMVLLLSIQPVVAQQGSGTPTEEIKIKVAKLGVGAKARTTVFLRDGRKIKGYIAQAGDADFVVRDRKTDAATTVRYDEVRKVDSNRGHSTARNLAIGIGIGAGAFLAILAITLASL